MPALAEVGVFGGSGFYSFLPDVEEVAVDTPYGPTSDRFLIGEIGGVRVAFLPRHGRNHHLPPHAIPYRANLWAMRELGVRRIVGPCAAGSLARDVPPGAFVVCDQFVDRTRGRRRHLLRRPGTTHVSAADPYCPSLRARAARRGPRAGHRHPRRRHHGRRPGPALLDPRRVGLVRAMGWQVVNMTGYPEGWLARELGLCYANVSLITDYDVGVEGDGGGPVSHDAVMEVFAGNIARLRDLLFARDPEAREARPLPRSPGGRAIDGLDAGSARSDRTSAAAGVSRRHDALRPRPPSPAGALTTRRLQHLSRDAEPRAGPFALSRHDCGRRGRRPRGACAAGASATPGDRRRRRGRPRGLDSSRVEHPREERAAWSRSTNRGAVGGGELRVVADDLDLGRARLVALEVEVEHEAVAMRERHQAVEAERCARRHELHRDARGRPRPGSSRTRRARA